jgi:hypothetical protein
MMKSNDRITVQSAEAVELHTAAFRSDIRTTSNLWECYSSLTHVTITVMSLSTGEHSATYINIMLKLMQLD